MTTLQRSRARARLMLAATLALGFVTPGFAQSAGDDHAGHGSHAGMKMDMPMDVPMDVPMDRHSGSHGDHAAVSGKATPQHKHKTSKTKVKPASMSASMPASMSASMPASDTAQHGGHANMGEMNHANMDHMMMGYLGPYSMSREGSGTSWLPDSTPMEGIHQTFGEWQTMSHALINLVYDHQGGPRGANKTFVGGMIMGMAQRPLGDATFGLRAMLAPDPLMGPNGYPLLLATGETADGRTHLVDRQHPHDLFMELAATLSYPVTATSSVFLYAGLPGEPALGPPAFMHRTSGADIPEAPITHHWLDSTHITFGVVTAGLVLDRWKIEASAFRGREPDQYRYDIEAPKLDSYSARLSFNPTRDLSMQVSWGHIQSPEALAPGVNENRLTASATYTRPFGANNVWSSTVAWGRKMMSPGDTLDGYLVESALIFDKTYTLFARAERVKENELTEDIPGLDHHVFTVGKVTLGGIYDIPVREHLKLGIGASVSRSFLPADLKPLYGGNPTAYMLFARLKVH
jgi:hypothetical protein